MYLSDEEQAMLAGEQGVGIAQAMGIITTLGTMYGAADLIPISSAHISGVSYKNLGEAGLDYLEDLAATGAKARVFATLNPPAVDMDDWQGSPLLTTPAFAKGQFRILDAFYKMGIDGICTCTPYEVNNRPAMGDHLSWAESSAVSFANSRLGARTNREGGPAALAAALTGRTARYGYHLDENRRADYVINVNVAVPDGSSLSALGVIVAKKLLNRTPLFVGFDRELSDDEHKLLGAAMAAVGSIALFHVEGQTPEAIALGREIIAPHAEYLTVDDLAEGYRALGIVPGTTPVDLVNIGCPHSSYAELVEIADLLAGRQVRTKFWIMCAPHVVHQAQANGVAERLTGCGVALLSGACTIVSPMAQTGVRSVATNTAKGAFYHSSYNGMEIHLGSTAKCVETAVSGIWQD